MNKVVFFRGLAVLVASIASISQAQFHQQSKKGPGVNQGAVNGAAYTGASRSGATVMNADGTVVTTPPPAGVQPQSTGGTGSGSVGANHFSTIYLSEAHKQAGMKIGEQADLKITKWGRAVHHSDGSYTQSVCQEGAQMMEQETRSKNGVLLQKRVVTLDQYSRAKEVLIYDGRDKFKYRGTLFYDQQGRFREEQLFTADETLIRRKVQEYALDGSKLPARSWDYVKDVPKDLQLVITHESEDDFKNGGNEPAEKKGGMFSNRSNQGSGDVQTGAVEQQASVGNAAAETQKTKGSNFSRFFGKKRNK